MWSYVDIYGNWTAPMVQVPGAFLDICHKNGVAASPVAAIPWATTPRINDGGNGSMIQAMVDGGYDKFLKYLNYYGIDGIGWNSEFYWTSMGSYMNNFKNLMGDCYTNAEAYGVPLFHNAWYSFTRNDGDIGDYSYLGTNCADWFHYNSKPVSTVYFLNYNWSDSRLSSSQSVANGFNGRSSFDVFAGINYQSGSSVPFPALQNYDISVGSVNTPAVTTKITHTSTAKDFHGFSSFIVARSSLICDDLANDPFVTYFNLGNGQFFNVEGERTFNNEWYNFRTTCLHGAGGGRRALWERMRMTHRRI